MALRPDFFKLDVWDAPGGSRITPTAGIVRLQNVSRQWPLNAPQSQTIVCNLNDAATQNLVEGSYYELTAGNPGFTSVIMAGKIQSLDTVSDRSNALTITGTSALGMLEEFLDLSAWQMDYGAVYTSVNDFLNGVQDPPASGQYPPGNKGVLPGTAHATWIDGLYTPATTPPGQYDSVRADNTTAAINLNTLGQMYGFQYREHVGSTWYALDIDYGPLGDSSGLQIWGGSRLVAQLNSLAGTSLTRPDASLAQQHGLAVITQASRNLDRTHVINIVFASGAEKGQNFVSLRKFNGGKPADDSGTAINGWTAWQPITGGRKYYYKAQSKTTFRGNTFELIAAQNNEGGWDYGVVDRTSAGIYGPIEHHQQWPHVHEPEMLLSCALAALEYNADPVAAWDFQVRHPMTSASGLPAVVMPGQTIDVRYQENADYPPTVDSASGSATFEQFIADSSFTMLDFPGVASTDPKYPKLLTCIEVTEEWTGHAHHVTYTMGRGHRNIWREIEQHAKQMERHRKKRTRAHTFHKADMNGTWWALKPNARERQKSLVLLPATDGDTAMADVAEDVTFFGRHYQVQWDMAMTGTAQYLDFRFKRDVAHDLMDDNVGTNYGVFRIANTTSGKETRFYSTSDGVTFTARGHRHVSPFLDGAGRVTSTISRFTVQCHDGHYFAYMTGYDSDTADSSTGATLIAEWADEHNDAGDPNSRVLAAQGTIGFKLTGGSTEAVLSEIHVHPHHIDHFSRAGHHPHNPNKHVWKNVVFEPTAWDGTHLTVKMHLKKPSGKVQLLDDAGEVLHNHWNGTDQANIEFATDLTFTGGTVGQWLIYNSTAGTRGGVASRTFGWCTSPKTHKASWHGVYLIGQIHDSVDAHTQTVWLSGWGHGHLQIHGAHVAPEAVGRVHQHPHNHTRVHWENMKFDFVIISGSQYFQWSRKDASKAGYLRADDGTIVHTFPAGGGSQTSTAVPPGAVIYFNPTSGTIDVYDSDGVSNHRAIGGMTFEWVYTSNDMTTEDAIPLHKVGHTDATADGNNGKLGLAGWHANVHVAQSQNVGERALDASHIAGRNTTGGTVVPDDYVMVKRASAGGAIFVDPSTLPGYGGGGMTNPMTTIDDIIVAASGGTPARLAKGADGTVLTIDPTTHHVTWDTPAAGAFTTKYGTVSFTGDGSTTSFFSSEWASGTFATGPVVVVTPTTSGGVDYPFAVSSSSTGLTLVFTNAPSATVVYYFNYIAVG